MSKRTAFVTSYSLVARPIELFAKGNSLGNATCFFVGLSDGSHALMTNWHVLSGRNPYTGQARHSSGAIPDMAKGLFCKKGNLAEFLFVEFSLLKENGEPAWFQHPAGQRYDIAFMLAQPNELFDIFPAIQNDETPNLRCTPGRDVFIIGYPLGVTKQIGLPIWKRGSIASEPELEADDLPVILVDSSTREGMSGSPVIAQAIDGALLDNGDTVMGSGPYVRFLGMYSGRYGTDIDDKLSVGRVWKRQVLEEMVRTLVPGNYTLSK